MTEKELLEAMRSEKMLSAITVLLNVAAFGSMPLYEDGTETPNRLTQLKTAKFLHSLHSDGVFEEEHEWLLNQVKLHERYSEPSDLALTDIELEALTICRKDGRVSVSKVQRLLCIGYKEASEICQSIIHKGQCDELQLAPSLKGSAAIDSSVIKGNS